MNKIHSFTTDQLKEFSIFRKNGQYVIQVTDDDKTVINKKKHVGAIDEAGIPYLKEDGYIVVAHIDNGDFQLELDELHTRTTLIQGFKDVIDVMREPVLAAMAARIEAEALAAEEAARMQAEAEALAAAANAEIASIEVPPVDPGLLRYGLIDIPQ